MLSMETKDDAGLPARSDSWVVKKNKLAITRNGFELGTVAFSCHHRKHRRGGGGCAGCMARLYALLVIARGGGDAQAAAQEITEQMLLEGKEHP